jgi:two-component system, NtrC family, sensor histidine kinase HydH
VLAKFPPICKVVSTELVDSTIAMTPQDPAQSSVAEKRDLLARLLSRLAHEIRNPLSSLDIHVQLLEEDLGEAAPHIQQLLSGRLEIIRGELTRLENIVRRFLRLASPSELDIETVELPAIFAHVTNLLSPEAAARQIEFDVNCDPALPTLMADGPQLTQAMLNLVINALQAVGNRGRIEIHASKQPQEEFVAIDVKDNGAGVPPDKLSEVFEPYFTTKEEGSGLGLWIVQQIAAAHGGNLRAANAPGGGAVFTLVLPLPKKDQTNG